MLLENGKNQISQFRDFTFEWSEKNQKKRDRTEFFCKFQKKSERKTYVFSLHLQFSDKKNRTSSVIVVYYLFITIIFIIAESREFINF